MEGFSPLSGVLVRSHPNLAITNMNWKLEQVLPEDRRDVGKCQFHVPSFVRDNSDMKFTALFVQSYIPLILMELTPEQVCLGMQPGYAYLGIYSVCSKSARVKNCLSIHIAGSTFTYVLSHSICSCGPFSPWSLLTGDALCFDSHISTTKRCGFMWYLTTKQQQQPYFNLYIF